MLDSVPTIASASRSLREGHTTSQALTETCLAAIEARNTELNAFITVMAAQARAAAYTADRELARGEDRGPLHGIPISLKDLIDVAGVPTTAASHVRAEHLALADSTITDRLRQAGAVIIGKTNLHEFAFGTTNEDSAYGPARHPLVPSRSPGGSSGGSAISVATGMALGSVGTDTGGSVRIPSAACGLVGLKPSFGEIPLDGVVPLSSSFDHAGPICRSVEDAQMLYHVLSGSTAALAAAKATPHTVRLGIPRTYFLELLDVHVAREFQRTCERLSESGVTLVDVRLPHTEFIASVYLCVSLPEAAAYHAATLDRTPDSYTVNVRTRLEAARYVLAEDYVRATRGAEVLRRAVDESLAEVDALLLPTLAVSAPLLGASTVHIDGQDQPVRNLMLRLTQLFNITGHPAISLPCGIAKGALPVGAQLVGHRGETNRLLQLARTLEQPVGLAWIR